MTPSPLELAFAAQLACFRPELPAWEAEYRFDAKRRWRFDYCFPNARLAVELDGGVWTQGRHSRGGGMERDNEKFNAAALAGWTVLRFTAGQVESGYAIRTVREFFRQRSRMQEAMP